MARLGRPPAGTALSAQEKIVLEGLCLGRSKGVVAQAIGRSSNTVKTHSLNILAKTGTHSIGNALAVAVARGEVTIKVELGEPLPLRQQQVLIGFAQGLSTKEIAKQIGVAVQTVKNDITKMYKTLNGVSRPHLVYLGFKTGNLTINRRKQA